MDTTQQANRKERIEIARKNCLMKLGSGCSSLESKEHKYENLIFRVEDNMDRECIERGHFLQRLVMAALFLGIVFFIKENKLNYGNINYHSVKSMVEYDNYVEKVEENIRIYMEKTIDLRKKGK